MNRIHLRLAVLLMVGQASFAQSPVKDSVYGFLATPSPMAEGRMHSYVLIETVNFFGTTLNGGAYCGTPYGNCGTVFAIESFYGTIAEAILYSFCSTGDPSTCTDGAFPEGGLVADKASNLYGTTIAGGIGTCLNQYNSCGTVSELTRSGTTWRELVLHQFSSTDGEQPTGQLTFDSGWKPLWDDICGRSLRLRHGF